MEERVGIQRCLVQVVSSRIVSLYSRLSVSTLALTFFSVVSYGPMGQGIMWEAITSALESPMYADTLEQLAKIKASGTLTDDEWVDHVIVSEMGRFLVLQDLGADVNDDGAQELAYAILQENVDYGRAKFGIWSMQRQQHPLTR